MNKIIINNKEYAIGNGKNITINNDTVIVDNVVIESGLSGSVSISFEGDLAYLNADNVIVNGNINGNVDCTSLKCKDINGDVDCTSLTCINIDGDVDCTTLKCNTINGSVKAKKIDANTINM